jgi:5-methylcytosine-specific restriction enzyme B
MSRYCGGLDTGPILNAAAHWRDAALLGEGSVFTHKRLWTVDALEALDRHFVQNLDEGDRGFMEKLQQQLAPTPAAAKQLAAEMIWLMYLCPSSLSVRHKREVPKAIWSWSGEPFPESSPWLAQEVLAGIGSAGPGFNQNQWRELTFLINLTSAFRRLSKDERTRVLSDSWKFAEWLKQVPDWRARQFRHMILFLLFPDDFERIFGQQDRKRIAQAFSGLDSQAINRLDPLELDRTLRETRKRLENEYGTSELDYYVQPLKERWQRESFAVATEGVTSAHVRKAIEDIDRDGIPTSAASVTYDLIYHGRRYPPKLVLSLAVKHLSGEELDRNAFTGGDESAAFNLLRTLGFEIEPKDAIPTLLGKFSAQAKAGSELSVQGYLRRYRGLNVRVSFGQGNFARIPWIAFLVDGQQVSDGIYPVLLYFREQEVLLLCYGLSETNEPNRSWGNLEAKPTVEAWFRDRFNRGPDRYGSSYVRAAYELTEELPIQDLNRDLDLMIDQYKAIMGNQPTASVPDSTSKGDDIAEEVAELPALQDLAQVVQSFSAALRESFVSFGAKHDDLVRSFVASIATKPLLILTGLSGSGKTQIAMRFGEWLGPERLYVAAVRPDWTGAEALFGYEDGLKPEVDGRAAWQVPGPLGFILRAVRDPQHPYLLLLDEMNLAHVERYFADVLSGMESGQPCLPNLAKGQDGVWRPVAGATPRLVLPRNLWVVGTVNVDETTYMFSPKVLDRANTFEFRVDSSELATDVRKPNPCSVGDQTLVRGLAKMASDDMWHQTNPASFRDHLADRLRQLQGLLARYGMEFGHRVFYESLRFAAFAEPAGLGTMEAVLDRVVLQKVMPRLHGSRRRLELPLLALAQFCRDLPEDIEADEKLPALQPDQPSGTAPKLPGAHDKLSRMLRSLRANQFASFTE